MARNKKGVSKHSCYSLAAYWLARVLVGFPNIFESSVSGEILFLLKKAVPSLKEKRFPRDRYDRYEQIPLTPKIIKALKDSLPELRDKAQNIDPVFVSNLDGVARLLGLSASEKTFLAFAALLQSYKPFANAFDEALNDCDFSTAVQILSFMLEIPEAEIRSFFSPEHRLVRSGLINISGGRRLSWRHDLDLLEGLVDLLFLPHKSPEEIFKFYVRRAPRSALGREDFEHVKLLDLAISYLRESLRQKLAGSNILFYGPPGTGKTELARVLAQEVGAELFEVSAEDLEKESLSSTQRLSVYRLGQALLSGHGLALILFDEAEGVLTSENPLSFLFREDTLNKATVNNVLETNPVPSIWIVNETFGIDPAFLRRFDLVISMKDLPRKTRKRIVSKHLHGIKVSPSFVEHLASIAYLPPGVLSRAVKVAKRAQEPTENTLETLIRETLEVMGIEMPKRAVSKEIPFILEALNTRPHTEELIRTIKRLKTGRMLFFGPPGTGKTALAHRIAELLDRELLEARASDILSPFIGVTERNLARLFAEAQESGAVLFLDEVDSLLLSRTRARYHWEISQINELLKQMEDFPGLFICATNFSRELDEAAARRFDFRVEFDYLLPEQALRLLENIFGERATEFEKDLQRLKLTPGNFATVYRRLSALGRLSPENFVKELAEESKINPSSARIGF